MKGVMWIDWPWEEFEYDKHIAIWSNFFTKLLGAHFWRFVDVLSSIHLSNIAWAIIRNPTYGNEIIKSHPKVLYILDVMNFDEAY
jgi:hypothetical protein